MVLSVIVGGLCGIVSVLVYWLFNIGFSIFLDGIMSDCFETSNLTFFQMLKLCMIPAMGGLVVCIIAKWVPEVMHAGTESYIRAYHLERVIRGIVIPSKIVASIFTITTGGSAGRIGVMAHVGAGIGSIVSSILKTDVKTRRLLLLCGTAGSVAAIFRAPFSGALFATEVLYKRDIESSAILPAFVSSITAYSVFYGVYRLGPVFETTPYHLQTVSELLLFAGLGIFISVSGSIYVKMYRFVSNAFKRMRTKKKYSPMPLTPALGGLLVGLLALLLQETFGLGYTILGIGWEVVQTLFSQSIPLQIALAVLFCKMLATSITLESGGSGGLFAPTLVIGAISGALFRDILMIFEPVPIHQTAFVIVGMAAMLTCAFKVPLTSILIVAELTGSYTLLPGIMIATTIVSIVSTRDSLFESQIKDRLHSPANINEMVVSILESMKVGDAMRRYVRVFRPHDRVQDVLDAVWRTGYRGFPVVDNVGRLVGIVTFRDAEGVPTEERGKPIRDIMSTSLITTTPDETLAVALQKLIKNDISMLPVVDMVDKTKLVGILSERDIMSAYAKASSEIGKR
jgi:CIC family chloride channel protein